MKIFKFRSVDWPFLAADLIQDTILSVLRERKYCSVMLTGGNTACRLYEAWAKLTKLKQQLGVSFYFGDERCVPSWHAESNYGMVMRTLFSSGIPEGCKIFRMQGEDPDREAAARRYSKSLPQTIDVMLIGVGEDGHVASIFPHSPVFEEVNRRVMSITSPGSARDRLTITPVVIDQTRNIFVLATGEVKKKVLNRALEHPNEVSSFPARLLLGANWLMDGA